MLTCVCCVVSEVLHTHSMCNNPHIGVYTVCMVYGGITDSEHTIYIHTPIGVSDFSQYFPRKMLLRQQYVFSSPTYSDEVLVYNLKLT